MTQPTLDQFRDFFLGTYDERTPEIEASDAIPGDLLREVAALGAYRLTVPTEHGGHGLDMMEYLH